MTFLNHITLYNKKVNKSYFWIFLYFVFRMGQGTSIFTNVSPSGNMVSFILFIPSFLYLFKKGRRYLSNIRFIILLITILVWCTFHCFYIDSISQISAYLMFVVDFISSYLIIMIYRKDIVFLFEKCVYLLSLLSLPFWIVNCVMGKAFYLLFPITFESSVNNAHSLLFYIFSGRESAELYGHLVRNSGFCWEPGLFASLIVLAICFNILLNNSTLNIKNRHIKVFIITLITTFSTTGYVAFFCLIAYYLLFSSTLSFVKKITLMILFVSISIPIYNLPFISEKINEKSDESSYAIATESYIWAEKEDRNCCLDRFEGLSAELLNISDKPLLGYGMCREDSYISTHISHNIVTANSITKPFSVLGFLLAIPMMILLYKSSYRLANDFNSPLKLMFIVVVLLLSISYDWFFTIMMQSFRLYVLKNKEV